MLKKVVYAGAQSASFVQATKDLKALAEVSVTRERVQRWTKRIGAERVAELEEQASSYEQMLLPDRRRNTTDQIPQVACVQMDGGRIQIRSRDASTAEGAQSGHWRESLVGCCVSMISPEHAEDPCPIIPRTFVDPERMSRLAREIKGISAIGEGSSESPAETPDDRPDKPQLLVRSIIATRQGLEQFGKRLIATAHSRNFNAAPRKAFVADGSASNWSVHRTHFSHYTPVLDFTHAICYVWAAACAGRTIEVAWQEYCQWAQWLWAGEIDPLIAAVAQRLELIGPPNNGDSETSPPQVVADTLGYLRNQQQRMKYADYRRQGLPITSSHIESTIKQINRRVKGTEKFWDQGAEPLLTLVADQISETRDLDRFWQRRPSRLSPTRCYAIAS
jgi:hypothetical protein